MNTKSMTQYAVSLLLNKLDKIIQQLSISFIYTPNFSNVHFTKSKGHARKPTFL